MKKLFLAIILVLSLAAVFTLAVSAGSIEVVDDGTVDITLGECVIDGLDTEIPEPSRGFTYLLDTDTQTAKITAWANYKDKELGAKFVTPSTIIYDGVSYTVNAFSRVVYATSNGTSSTSNSNYVLTHVYVSDEITAIPKEAFAECRALEYVYVGKNVETIGAKSFYYAGFTAGSYYVTVEETTTDPESGEEITTTVTKRIEEAGGQMGGIKAFIWKTQKITTLTDTCFHHVEFDRNTVYEFPFDKITTYESNCMSYNQHAFQSTHYFASGAQLYLDVFDLRGATSVATNAFSNATLANTIIVNADQVNCLSPHILRGQGTSMVDHNTYFIVCGGETPAEATTLTAGIWYPNAWYWGSDTVHFSICIRGYVNAFDGADGLENQNGYGHDVVDYFFETEDAFRYYINSVASTTSAATTLTRFAKCNKGYFNVCTVENGVHSFSAYDIKYTAATETDAAVLEIVSATRACPAPYAQYYSVLGDDCTASTLCFTCDFVYEAGLEHNISESWTYKNGYLAYGEHKIGCIREGCDHGEIEELFPLFTNKGYSKEENGSYFTYGIVFNKEAISLYEEKTGEKISYGLVAAKYTGNENGILINENGEAIYADTTVQLDFTGSDYTICQVKVTGVNTDEYKAKSVYCAAYYIQNGAVKYIGNEISNDALLICYNDIK